MELSPANSRGVARRASPRARRALFRRGIDISSVVGSGPNGRIIESDVPESGAGSGDQGIRRPMSAIRKTIARRLSLSKLTIPHFYTRQSINARSLMDFYQRRKQQHHCTLNDVIVKAVALAVHEFPEFRSRIDEETIIETPNTHIGVAVGIEGGLVVPTVLHADRLPLQDLSKTIRGLVELARERRIENAGKSVFTVSNLGMLGTEEFTAIINPPEVAILAVGAICSRPVVVNGALAAGLVMVLTLSCDHRVIDGVVAAKFMAQLQRSLESPDEYLTL